MRHFALVIAEVRARVGPVGSMTAATVAPATSELVRPEGRRLEAAAVENMRGVVTSEGLKAAGCGTRAGNSAN